MATSLQTPYPDINVLIENSHFFIRKAHVEIQCIYKPVSVLHTMKQHWADDTLMSSLTPWLCFYLPSRSSADTLISFHTHLELLLTKRYSSKVSQTWQLPPWPDVRSMGWGEVENPYPSPVGLCWPIQNAYNIQTCCGIISLSVIHLGSLFKAIWQRKRKWSSWELSGEEGWKTRGKLWGPALGTSQMKGEHCHLSPHGILTFCLSILYTSISWIPLYLSRHLLTRKNDKISW